MILTQDWYESRKGWIVTIFTASVVRFDHKDRAKAQEFVRQEEKKGHKVEVRPVID